MLLTADVVGEIAKIDASWNRDFVAYNRFYRCAGIVNSALHYVSR